MKKILIHFLVLLTAVTGFSAGLVIQTHAVEADKAPHVRVFAHGGFHRFGISKDSIKSQVEAYKRDLCPETDVRLTKDHVAVNMHDAKVDRSTDGHGFVRDMTFAEVHALTLSDGQHPPSLVRSMKVAARHGHKCLMPEMKDTDWTPTDYQNIQHLAVQLGLKDSFRFYISRVPFIEMADNNAPKVKVVWKLLRDTTPREVRSLSLNAIVPRGGRLFRPFIDSIHRIGVKVYAGVNASDEPDEWERLNRLHINGTINNVPVATKRYFDNH